MRLLVISPWYPNRTDRNAGSFVRSMARLVLPEVAVTVVTVIPDRVEALEVEDKNEDGLRVIRGYFAGDGARVQRLYNRSRAWRTALRRAGIDYDLIHAHVFLDGGVIAARYARKLHIPFVVSEHASRFLETSWPLSRLPDLYLARRVARKAARVLPVSPALREGMLKHGLKGNYRVLSNVVDDAVFRPPAAVEADRPFTFFHVSDFSPNKRLPLLLAGFLALRALHPESRLVIAGEGDPALVRQAIQHLNGEEDCGITVLGFEPTGVIADWMRTSDAFVLTSAVETQSVVVIEALLSGTPVISTRCGGPESILTDPEYGILLPDDTPGALTRSMATSVRQGRRTLGERRVLATLTRKRYGTEVIRRELLNLYTETVHA